MSLLEANADKSFQIANLRAECASLNFAEITPTPASDKTCAVSGKPLKNATLEKHVTVQSLCLCHDRGSSSKEEVGPGLDSSLTFWNQAVFGLAATHLLCVRGCWT